MIRAKVIVNEHAKDIVNEMKAEIDRLNSELESKQPTDISAAGVNNNMLQDILIKLRKEQEEHLTTAQKGFMLDGACKPERARFCRLN
ncbi:hypothetical protein BGX34_000640 [Mortierella sp. NVP85]|nr:hypothetical protein BGX34_000640 [Mortierella sp. NVP85]